MAEELTIGVDVSRAYREFRGIPIYTRNILAEFGQIASQHQFILLHYPERAPETTYGIEGAEAVALPYSGKYVPWFRIVQEQFLYPRFQNKLNLDVVWHPQNHGQWLTPVGFVCTLHDVLPIARPDMMDDLGVMTPDERALNWSRIHSVKGASRVITISEYSRGQILAHLGLPADKVVTIHNGIDHTVFRPNIPEAEKQRVLRQYQLPENYVLTVGAYAPHKNLLTLLKAYHQSELPRMGIGLVMVGPKDQDVYTSDTDGLNTFVQANGLGGLVRMLDPIPLVDLAPLYAGAQMFVITSMYEGFGFPPLEAMASGVPVVSSDVTSLPEVCGDAALYSDPYNVDAFAAHMHLLATDPDAYERHRQRGIQQAKKFTWRKAAERTLQTLVGVVK